MKRIIIALSVLLSLALIVALLFFRNPQFSYSGIVEAIEIDITPKISDTIIKFHVKEGDKISKDQPLFELEGKDILTAYNFSKIEFERTSEIYKRNATSKENYDTKKYKYDDATIKKRLLFS
jgi:multidrug resistance efflux pump